MRLRNKTTHNSPAVQSITYDNCIINLYSDIYLAHWLNDKVFGLVNRFFNMTNTKITFFSRSGKINPARSRISVTYLLVVWGFLMSIHQSVLADDYQSRFQPVRPAHYIAVLADPEANSGNNAETWGYWPLDPGPRGVKLHNYEELLASDGVAPTKWLFDSSAWWLEENGLIMEAPHFPLPPGEYLVTGGRQVLSALIVYPADDNGNQRWELEHNATVHDVTHLGCRSAVYTPSSTEQMCTPENAPRDVFRVAVGELMPEVEGCHKQDYAVLIVVGLAKL
jgi:hypothetical protein